MLRIGLLKIFVCYLGILLWGSGVWALRDVERVEGAAVAVDDGAFEAVIVVEGPRSRCSETSWSRGGGGGEDALSKVGEFGADWRDEEKNFPRLMKTFTSLFFFAHESWNLSRKSLFSSCKFQGCEVVFFIRLRLPNLFDSDLQTYSTPLLDSDFRIYSTPTYPVRLVTRLRLQLPNLFDSVPSLIESKTVLFDKSSNAFIVGCADVGVVK